ncbi:MAG: glycosyltransferase family 2 protein [Bacteroidales bacterium]|nr:glycosyltransferase family 2 protein [Bacteroidales bacterium]
MKTAVVILNWNTKEFLEKFLPPLIESTEGLDAEVIVADSASTDASMEMMSEKFPKIRQIRLKKNYGFTGGYNRSLALVEAEYYVLINSDIEVPKNWLSPLVEWMDTHPECGACGPKLHSWYDRDMFEYAGAAGGYLDRYGYPFCRGRVMSKIEKDTGQYDIPANVLWVSGACLMVRSSLWNSLGGLDDRFFAHMEEIDLCWRIQLSGFKVTVVPSSVVYHIGGGTLPKKSPYKLFLNYRNNLLMLENNLPKTIGRKRARRRILTRMILDGMSGIVYLITGKWESFKAVVKAHREYRKLRRRTDEDAHANIDGLVNYWMIPRNLLFLQK